MTQVDRSRYMKKTTILIGIKEFLNALVQLSIMSIVLGGLVQGLVAYQGLTLIHSLVSWGWNVYMTKTQTRMINVQSFMFKHIVVIRCIVVLIDLSLTVVVLVTNSVNWFFVLLIVDVALLPITYTINLIDSVSDNIIMYNKANISDVQYLATKRSNTLNISTMLGQGVSIIILTTLNMDMIPLWACAIALHISYAIDILDKAYWQRLVKDNICKHYKKQLKKLQVVD